MNHNKWTALFLSLALILGLLAGCAPTVVSQETPAENTPAEEAAPAEPAEETGPVKTGLSFVTSTASSQSAGEEGDGVAQSDIMLVAVTVGDDGIIDSCVIDSVQAKLGFNAEGVLITDVSAPIPSKNELGDAYGMGAVSPIGKEWNEQAAAFADYVVGLTVEEVKGIAVTEEGRAAGEDLAASVTIRIGDFQTGVENAVSSAVHTGAQKGDKLTLDAVTTAAGSKNATAEEDGLAQIDCTVTVTTTDGDTVTGSQSASVQTNVTFDNTGTITGELSEDIAPTTAA